MVARRPFLADSVSARPSEEAASQPERLAGRGRADSDLSLLGDLQGVVHFNAKVPHG